MARINLEEMKTRLDNQQSGNFIPSFFLKGDGSHNIVKFLLNSVNDIEIFSVHSIRLAGKNGNFFNSVNCTGAEDCALCREAVNHTGEKMPLVSRTRDNVYIPVVVMYDKDGKFNPYYAIWERSTKFFRDTLAPTFARYDIHGAFEIERRGVAPQVQYNIYNVDKDFEGNAIDFSKSVEDYKKEFDVKDDDVFGRANSYIHDWNPEQIKMFVSTGKYPVIKTDEENKDEAVAESPQRRTAPRTF